MDVIKLTVQETANKLNEDGISLEKIGVLFGVSKLHVNNYMKGKTKNPKPNVCWNVYNNVIIDNKKVLVGPYVDAQHLENTMKMLGAL